MFRYAKSHDLQYSERKTIIFDLDDTLIQTQLLYDDAKQRFAALMAAQGFIGDVISTLDEIDRQNVETFGFSRHRFPRSMEETYAHFCSLAGKELDPEVAEIAQQLGYSVFEQTPEMVPHAKEVLDQLRRLGYQLILYTLGDPDVQADRIAQLGFADYFDFIHVVSNGRSKLATKNAGELKRLLANRNLSARSTWMVGNSPRSDILPARHLGMPAIHFASETWNYDEASLAAEEVYSITDLREILGILARQKVGVTQSYRVRVF